MTGTSFKVAFIGSHGVGKTTLCYGLAARLKARDVVLDVVDEVARRCPLPINRDTTLAAQSWIIHTQIADELVAASRNELVVCDRSVLDNYVYLLLAAGRQPTLADMIDTWMSTYDLLVHVPVLDPLRPDGTRSTDPAFQRAVDQRLEQEIEGRSLSTLSLTPHARETWVETVEAAVWNRVRPAQLELLD